MRLRALIPLLFALSMVLVPRQAGATGIGVLTLISPVSHDYVLGADFIPFTLSALGDITAQYQAVDTVFAPDGARTSGCEASDFTGFVAGRIALVQRGVCTFEQKTANAAAAGAVGIIIFNRGDASGVGFYDGTLTNLGAIPAVAVTFAVGQELGQYLTAGGIVRIQVTENTAPVPEPSTLALLGVGVAVLVGRSLRRRG